MIGRELRAPVLVVINGETRLERRRPGAHQEVARRLHRMFLWIVTKAQKVPEELGELTSGIFAIGYAANYLRFGALHPSRSLLDGVFELAPVVTTVMFVYGFGRIGVYAATRKGWSAGFWFLSRQLFCLFGVGLWSYLSIAAWNSEGALALQIVSPLFGAFSTLEFFRLGKIEWTPRKTRSGESRARA